MEQEVKPVVENQLEDLEKAREDFYNVALHLFEAAKVLRSYDILFTDVLLGQATYFLNLSDNQAVLRSVVGLNNTTPFKKIEESISEEVKVKIEDYAQKVRDRIAQMKKEKDASI